MGKNGRNRAKNGRGWFGGCYWQSEAYNRQVYQKNLADLVKLATNRFRWEGLPESVNTRYLEMTLLQNGMATICHPEGSPDTWYGLGLTQDGSLTAYGEPASWTAIDATGNLRIPVQRGSNGVLVYDSNQLYGCAVPDSGIWNMLQIMARRLTQFERTEDANLSLQQAAWFISCEQEKRQDAINLYKQVCGYEPAVIASPTIRKDIGLEVIKTDVPYIGRELEEARNNVMLQVYTLLGIDHLSYEKGERMIEQEAEGNEAPTNLRLLDALQPRRKAARELSELLGQEVRVVFNTDYESDVFQAEKMQSVEEVEDE